MNETLKTISERYSCRDFADTPLTEEQLDAIAKAALAAPSAINKQPWRVIMVTDKALIEEFDAAGLEQLVSGGDIAAYERIQSRGGKMLYNAPCMVVIAIEDTKYSRIDCGIITQNVALAAQSLGLGNVICAMTGLALLGPKGEELRARLRFPQGFSFGMSVLVGTPNSGKEPHALDWDKIIRI